MKKDKKDAYYFKHDANSRNDIALSAVRSDAETFAQGRDSNLVAPLANLSIYGFYFMLIEILREQADFKLKNNAATKKYIAKETQIPMVFVESFLEMLLDTEIHLLKIEDGYIYSERLLSDMEDMNEVRGQYVKAGIKSGEVRRKKKGITSQDDEKPESTEPPKPRKSNVFTPRFYSLWKDYCNSLGGDNAQRRTELDSLESKFAKREQELITKLYMSINNETTSTFFKEITK